MRTFRLIGMAIIAILISVNFTACSGDDENSNPTVAQLKGTWFNGDNEDYPYLIIEEGYFYFSESTSIVTSGNKGEKYKYTFDSKTNIMTCHQYDFDENKYFNEVDYFRVKSVSDIHLTIEILNDNQSEVYETMEFTKK